MHDYITALLHPTFPPYKTEQLVLASARLYAVQHGCVHCHPSCGVPLWCIWKMWAFLKFMISEVNLLCIWSIHLKPYSIPAVKVIMAALFRSSVTKPDTFHTLSRLSGYYHWCMYIHQLVASMYALPKEHEHIKLTHTQNGCLMCTLYTVYHVT